MRFYISANWSFCPTCQTPIRGNQIPETLGTVEAYALRLEAERSIIPKWTPREEHFVADMLITEGFCTTTTYRRRKTRELIKRPALRMITIDRRQSEQLSKLWGIKTTSYRMKSKLYGYVRVYCSEAGGVRGTIVLINAWNSMLECDKKEIYRDFMFDFAIPYTEQVTLKSPPHLLARITKEVGYKPHEITSLIRKWEENNRDKPRLSWRKKERQKLWLVLREKPKALREIEIPI